MTTRKGFKRVVRDRMAKTGERYAAARRALMATEQPPTAATQSPDATYAMRGGLHPETANLTNILAARGVTSPFTSRPLSEAMVLGIGGGLGAGYILWEFKSLGDPILTLGFRNQWQYPAIPGWYEKTAKRLEIPSDLHETGGARAAQQALDGVLAQRQARDRVRRPAAVRDVGPTGRPLRVLGLPGCSLRADRGRRVSRRSPGRAPLVVGADRMALARGRVGSFKHRLIVPNPTSGPLDAGVVRRAIRAGLDDQVTHLGEPSDSFSLPAWRKWSRLMTDTRNAKGWPKVFADGAGLFGALLSIVEGVDGEIGATGGHLRELYASFLDEAAAVIERPQLADAAVAWRVAADQWEDLADAAVPNGLDGGADAVEAAEALHDAVLEGEPGRDRTREAARTLWSIRGRYATDFPLPAADIEALLADLGRRIGEIYETERDALAATARAMGAG